MKVSTLLLLKIRANEWLATNHNTEHQRTVLVVEWVPSV